MTGPTASKARRGRRVVHCDISRLRADAATVAKLARLRLAARRAGYVLIFENAKPELGELMGFLGLEKVLLAA
ncbi:MAG TPA: hypothetical protein VEU77_00100 [Candidatus Acidoferrales bacterium]|nr:hypothetical protein [Candidatus Acidoferrales bacterium]